MQRFVAVVCIAGLALAAGGSALAQAAAGKAASELTECAAANRANLAELAQTRDAEIRRHAMHPLLVSRLQGLGSALARLRESTARPPRKAADCDQVEQALTAWREQLESIVGSPAQSAECQAANRDAQAGLQAGLLALQQAGTAPPSRLEAASRRSDRLRAAIERGVPTLVECRSLSAEIATEVAQLQALGPAPAKLSVAAPAAAAASVAASAGSAAPAPLSLAAADACRQAQRRHYNDMVQAFARFLDAGPIATPWLAPLQAMSDRLTRLHGVIGNAAAADWDCAGVARSLEQLRSELGQMRR